MATQIVRGGPGFAGEHAPAATEGLFARLVATWRRFWSYHRTRHELEMLNDRELADIGLSRSDIYDVARRCAHDVV